MAAVAELRAIVPGFAPADYASRMCNACASCGAHALDAGADLCPRCHYVARLIEAWGAGEIVRRVMLVSATVPGETLPGDFSMEGTR